MSSSEQEQGNQNEAGTGAGAEGGEDTAAAAATMDTTATHAAEEAEETEPSTWDLAREASSRMVLQSVLDDMESSAAKQKEELQLLRRRAEEAESSLAGSNETIQRLEASLREGRKGKDDLSGQLREATLAAEVARETSVAEKERADRSAAESDRLREEISHLTKSNLTYQKQVAEAEAQAKLDGSSLFPLQLKTQSLENENERLRTHATWLEGELSKKAEALSQLKSSTALESARSRASVDTAQSERDALAIEANQLRQQLEKVETKAQGLARQLMEAKQEASDVKLDSEQELTASRRLVDLQKEQLIRLEQKHDALARRLDSTKALAEEAETEDLARWKERESTLMDVARNNLKAQAEEFENRILSMKEELEAANSRCKRAEDGLMLIEDAPESKEARPRLALPPSEGNGENGDEPLNLTDLYGRVAQAEDALHAETIRRKKAEIRVSRIEEEIEANAPLLIRQRKEYEHALQQLTELRTRFENSQGETAAIRNESDILESEVNRLKAENKDLTEEAKILAKQVRDMLIANSSSGGSDPNVALTVSQMGAANTRLMKEYNALTTKVKELETSLSQNDGLYQQIQDLKAENASLEEQRKREEGMVEKIVQQRDLYRAILNKQDTNLLGSGEDESNALAVVRGQSERTKALEAKHNKLIEEHAAAQARLDLLARDQEAASERLARYEMLNDELTQSIDKAKNEIDANAAAVARSQAEAVFFKDRAQLLEETQQRNREEIKNVTASKNLIMTTNTNLEQSLVKANMERSKMEDELRNVQSKLMLAQAEAESAKAAERRVSEESSQLRSELSRREAVLDGVQRIESSLLMKNNADVEAYKLEISALKENIESAKQKEEASTNALKETISNQELQVTQLESARAKATKEALEAKKESLLAVQKADAATKKCSILESQLRAAKKKLGVTEGDSLPDIESELRTKLESITTDLEGSKTEVETWKKRAATYEKLAKDNEDALSAMTEASNASKKLQEDDNTKLKEELERINTEMSKRKEIITELTNDLATQREVREKAVNEVKQQITGFKTEAENYQKKAEDAEYRYCQLQNDVNVVQSDLVAAQGNYERELTLHAEARTSLRLAREENEKANRLRNDAIEELAALESKYKIQDSILEVEKTKREEAEKEFTTKMDATRAENTLLHSQLEKINEQVEKMQSRHTLKSEAADAEPEDATGDEEMFRLRMTVSELRELVKFVRAEKDSIQLQLDSAKRSTERERTKAAVARRTVEETQAELDVLRESLQNKSNGATDEGADKLKTAEEQSRLLSDSNAHLQRQVQDLEANLARAKQEVEESKKALQPSADKQKQLESDKAVLLAEKDSLLREIDDWKGRVQSLVSKFNQVDPEEHLKVVKKSEELEKQVKSIEEKKSYAEEESKRIRTLASRASSELSKNKQLVETHKKSITKLTAEKAALVKAQKESVSKKEIDELKQKTAKLEEERKAEEIQAKGSREMNEKLRNRLREFQKQIIDLRKEKTSLTKQLEEARSKIEQKGTKAVALLKEKESAVATKAATTPVDAAAKDPPVTTKSTVAVQKQSATTSTTPSTTESKTTAVVEKKVMPKVPVGGFKFAPSKPVEKGNPKKRPATELTIEAPVQQKKPAGESEPKTANEAARSPKLSPKSSPTRPAPPNRRTSGELKQMSLKEKLLEKKRKLQELKRAKEDSQKEDAKPTEPVSTEPETKRNKTESDGATEKVAPKPESKSEASSLSPKAPSFVPNASLLKVAAAQMAAKTQAKDTTESSKEDGPELSAEEGEMEEGEEAPEPPKADTPAVASAGPSASSIFGGGTPVQTTFGSGFGKAASVFGSGSTATSFGTSSAFGSGGTGFGSAATTTSVFGGGKKTETGSAAAPAPTGFGSAAFLNIKPPGSTAGSGPPQFSFGTSGSSITLPTPGTATTPKMTMFNAFSSPAPSQGFGRTGKATKPLFGDTTQETKEETEQAEDGEMPDSEDASQK